jgi:hypothetical protein
VCATIIIGSQSVADIEQSYAYHCDRKEHQLMDGEEKEVNFYSDQKGVRITSARLIVGNTTYAMLNVSSVSMTVTKPSLFWPVTLVLVGAAIMLAALSHSRAATSLLVVGALLALVGVVAWRGSSPTYHVRISASSGESTALSSSDKGYVEKVIRAINEAIIHRG